MKPRSFICGMCCLVLPALLAACGEPATCTSIELHPLTGDVFDKDGNAIVPDRVTVAYSGGTARECAIEPPVQGAARFRCPEGYDVGVLTAYYGSESTSRGFEVRMQDDGCHALEQEVDLAFE